VSARKKTIKYVGAQYFAPESKTFAPVEKWIK